MFYFDGTSDFMQKDYIVDQIRFVVRFSQDGKEIYIATPPVFSSLAAQMLCGEVMAPLHWQPTGKQITFLIGYKWSSGVGYKVPPRINAEKALDKLFHKHNK